MKTLKNIFDFYINSSIHVAIAITSLVQITFIKYNIHDQYEFLFFSFLGAITAYNFVKYSNVSILYYKQITKFVRAIRIFTIFTAILFVYYAFRFPIKIIAYIIPLALLTVFYIVPVFPNKKNLRSISGIKIFIIGLMWAGITVVVPLVLIDRPFDLDFFTETLQRFLFIIIIILPFEIRDLQYDEATLETVPQKIGVTRTKLFGSILLVVFMLLTAAKETLLSSIEILSTILITTITLLFLWGTERKQSRYYCSFWVESIPIIWLVIIIVLQEILA